MFYCPWCYSRQSVLKQIFIRFCDYDFLKLSSTTTQIAFWIQFQVYMADYPLLLPLDSVTLLLNYWGQINNKSLQTNKQTNRPLEPRKPRWTEQINPFFDRPYSRKLFFIQNIITWFSQKRPSPIGQKNSTPPPPS